MAHGRIVLNMAERLARAKGRYVGLQTYLKNVTGELNGYVSSEDMTQYGTVHEEILSLLETNKIEVEVINHNNEKSRAELSSSGTSGIKAGTTQT